MTALREADRGFRLLSRRQPRAWASLVAMADQLWQGPHVDVRAMELVRLRIAGLVGADAFVRVRAVAAQEAGLSEHVASRPGDYPTSNAFSPLEQACLAYAEQVVMDPGSIAPATREAVRAELGDRGLVQLTVASGLFEGLARASVSLGFVAPQRTSVRSLAELAD